MIKLESIIKENKNNDMLPLTLLIGNDKFNYIYSDKKENIEEIFSIMTGFYHSKLGHIIYDDFNFNEMNLKEKSIFIKSELEIISPLTNIDGNKTLYSLIKRQMIFCDLLHKNYQEYIIIILEKFKLQKLKYEKLKNLSNDNILMLYILLASIKNPRYIFIYDFEKYLFNDYSLLYFLKKLKEHSQINATFIFFSTRPINANNEISYFDLTKKNTKEKNILTIRNRNFVNQKKFNKNIFGLLTEIIKNSKYLLLLFLFFQCILLSIFFITNITSANISIIDNAFEAIQQINVISILLIFILNILFMVIFLFRNDYLIYKMTRCGQNIFKINLLYIFIYMIFFFLGVIISFAYPLIKYFNILSAITWFQLILIPISSFISSFFLFIVIFVFKNKKILRKNTEFI